MGKHKAQGVSDTATTSFSSFSSRPAGAAAGPGPHRPRGTAGRHRGAHGEAAAAAPAGTRRAALRGAGRPETLAPPGPGTDLLPGAASAATIPPRGLPAHAPPTAAPARPRLRCSEGALRLRPGPRLGELPLPWGGHGVELLRQTPQVEVQFAK